MSYRNTPLAPLNQKNTSYSHTLFHSMDYYHRLTIDELEKLEWVSLETYALQTLDARLKSGGTEWQCECDGVVLSMAWDWIQREDGEVEVDTDAGIRTNILARDQNGYDLSVADTQNFLLLTTQRLNWVCQTFEYTKY